MDEAALLDAIAHDLDATDPFLVYADWLQGRGDPRGELIALMHRDAAAAPAYLEKHAEQLLGPLAAWQKTLDGDYRQKHVAAFRWHLGFIRDARFAWDYYADEKRGQVKLGDGIRALFAHPSGRFVRSLTIGLNRADPDQLYQPVIDAIVECKPAYLETLHVGDYEFPDDTEISWTEIGNLGAIWAALPRLRTLVIQGGGIALGNIDAPALRELSLRSGGLPAEAAQALARGKMPNLETLIVWFGRDEYGGDATAADALAILDRTDLPKLRYLGLMNSEFADELCLRLGDTPLLRQLEVLDLSMGTMTDEGARALVAATPRFAHLDRLILRDNYLGSDAELRTSLTRLAKQVDCAEQREADEYDGEVYRYASVGE